MNRRKVKYNDMTNEEAHKNVSDAAAVVKLVCGVGNNAAWLVMLDGYDHARRCKGYGYRQKQLFKMAINEFHNYERGLKHAEVNRMFRLEDMREEVRRKYGDISDSEYYDFWRSIGGPAYSKTKPLITSLWNKYRISLEQHKVKEAEHKAWVMTAQAAIDLALALYDGALKECEAGCKMPRRWLESVFGQFSLKRVSKAWHRAMMALAPETEPIKLDSVEEKNIDLGLRQLMEAWLDPELLYSSTSETVEDYDEIFATRGFQKKVLREIAEVRSETIKNLNNDRTAEKSGKNEDGSDESA